MDTFKLVLAWFLAIMGAIALVAFVILFQLTKRI